MNDIANGPLTLRPAAASMATATATDTTARAAVMERTKVDLMRQNFKSRHLYRPRAYSWPAFWLLMTTAEKSVSKPVQDIRRRLHATGTYSSIARPWTSSSQPARLPCDAWQSLQPTCLPVGIGDVHLSAGLSSSREVMEVEKREATDAHVSP